MTPSSPAPHAFDPSSLQRIEQVYRRELSADPANPTARISLAWCLFMQALVRAGQESVLATLAHAEAEEDNGDGLDRAIRLVLEQDADSILGDCLRQTTAVRQISADPHVHGHADRIEALVKLSGGGTALTVAEDEAARVLAEVTREILQARPAGGLQRIATRRAPTERG